MEIYIKVIIAAILLLLAVMDFKKKEVPLWLIAILLIASITGRLILGVDMFSVLSGISVGGVILGIAFLTKEKIGIGDGLIAICLGLYMGGEKVILSLLIASIIMTIVSVILLLMKKGKMETTLPFIPAIFIGFLIV